MVAISRTPFDNVLTLPTKHNDQFGLEVKTVIKVSRKNDVLIVVIKGVRKLAEKGWFLRDRSCCFFGMLPIVEAYADYFLRSRNKRRKMEVGGCHEDSE